ncbi:hypothetical protein C8J57DRAFT_1526272 [Mycena rebaudengoi]|nr:hypothetical protein C8J57DRAFT_1526272 [Mycena rebaudengoi]
MPKKTSFSCRCSLRPAEHLVLIAEKEKHQDELAKLSNSNAATTTLGVGLGPEVLSSLRGQGESAEKEAVISAMRLLDTRISVVGAALPPSKTPLVYEAGHIFKSPIQELDTIAQVMVLLGIVCHVIIGLGTDPCNFILTSVRMLIELAMSLNPKRLPNGDEVRDAQQEDVLKQPPSSLYVALEQFKLDGKIPTMYRTDFDHPDWQSRDVNDLRRQVEVWRDAETIGERAKISAQYGVRWSEVGRLPYWNPCQMLVVDPMHCVLEGAVHYHCRSVLGKRKEPPWDEYMVEN